MKLRKLMALTMAGVMHSHWQPAEAAERPRRPRPAELQPRLRAARKPAERPRTRPRESLTWWEAWATSPSTIPVRPEWSS